MRRLLVSLICAVLAAGGWALAAAPASSQSRFPAAGVPLVLTARNGHLDATARITKMAAGPEAALQSQWSEPDVPAPRSQVGRLRLRVSGHEVIVPLSAVLDLYQPDTASLKPDRSGFVLEIHGGDGSLGYVTRIHFDAHRVLDRQINGGEGGELWERTTYSNEPFPYE